MKYTAQVFRSFALALAFAAPVAGCGGKADSQQTPASESPRQLGGVATLQNVPGRASTQASTQAPSPAWSLRYSDSEPISMVSAAAVGDDGSAYALVRFRAPDLGRNGVAKITNGKLAWLTRLGSTELGTDELTAIAVSGSTVIVAGTWYGSNHTTSGMVVTRLDDGGHVLGRWRDAERSSFGTARLCGDGNAIAFGSASGSARVVSVDATGAVIWAASPKADGATWTSAAVGRCLRDGGVVMAGGSDKGLAVFALDGSGKPTWSMIGNDLGPAPAAIELDGSDDAFVLTARGELVAIDATGRRLYTYASGADGARLAVDGDGNAVLVGARDGVSLTERVDASGALVWQNTGAASSNGVDCDFDDGGDAFVLSSQSPNAGVAVYDAAGAPRWQATIAGAYPTWAGVANGRGYTVSRAGGALDVTVFAVP